MNLAGLGELHARLVGAGNPSRGGAYDTMISTVIVMAFREIAGHARLLRLLSRAVARESLPPSLIFAGPPGVGKRRVALALAQALNCLSPGSSGNRSGRAKNPGVTVELEQDACGNCAACTRIARGTHADVWVIAPGDTGAIKIDQVRDVIDRAMYRPFEGRRRTVIVDEADAMVSQAQNALLKTLEEPPPGSVFILVSSRPDTLLPTVRSRCLRLRFGRLSTADVVAILVRDHAYTEADARAAAACADGSLARALEAGSAGSLAARANAYEVLRAAAGSSEPRQRLESAKELTVKTAGRAVAADREETAGRLRAVASLLRDLGVLVAGADKRALANGDLAQELERLGRSYGHDRIMRAFTAVDRALAALERNASPKVVADWLVFQL